jgi:hypothetical protein
MFADETGCFSVRSVQQQSLSLCGSLIANNTIDANLFSAEPSICPGTDLSQAVGRSRSEKQIVQPVASAQ